MAVFVALLSTALLFLSFFSRMCSLNEWSDAPFHVFISKPAPSLNCFDRHSGGGGGDLFDYLIFSSYLSRNDLTYRVVTVPLEQVHNYTFKCST